MSASASPVLEVSHLSVSFSQYERGLRRRTVTPVIDMSLSVLAGEVVVLVGESGAGKSLIGLAAMGLLPPNAREAGTISYRGVVTSPEERRALAGSQMALLPQSTSFLDPRARVGSQLRRGAELAGLRKPRAVAQEVVERFALPRSTLRLYPHQLSGGMARRVLFSLATLARPRLVFADEPTPGLDPDSAAEIIAAIRDLADEGSAVILVSHDMETALKIADRIVVCRAGRTVEEATPVQFNGDGGRLRHGYSRALWRALPAQGFHLLEAYQDRGAAE